MTASYKPLSVLNWPQKTLRRKKHKVDLTEANVFMSYLGEIPKTDRKHALKICGFNLTLDGSGADQTADWVSKLNSTDSVTDLVIVGDTITINRAILATGINVFIYARKLVIGQKGKIDTTPTNLDSPKAVKGDGAEGRRAGNISIFADEFVLHPDVEKPVFVTKGGRGQDGTNGTGGADGLTCAGWAPDQADEDDNASDVQSSISNSDVDKLKEWAQLKDEAMIEITVIRRWYDKQQRRNLEQQNAKWNGLPVPTSGLPGIAGSKPGPGGAPGTLNVLAPLFEANLSDFSGSMVDLGPGEAGQGYAGKGGRAGFGYNPTVSDISKPAKTYVGRVVNKYINFKHTEGEWTWSQLELVDGPDSAVPVAPPSQYKTGEAEKTERPAGWFHELHKSLYVDVIRALYLAEDRTQLGEILDHVEPAVAKAGATIAGHSDVHSVALRSLQQEVERVRWQMSHGLDAFGHPLGWSPSLTLGAELKLYSASVNHAINGLYVGAWFRTEKEMTDKAAGMAAAGITTVQRRRKAALERLDELDQLSKTLDEKISDIDRGISGLNGQLIPIKEYLKKKARRRVLWKSWLNVVENVAKIIPVYQPELGMVASLAETGTDHITDVAPDSGANVTDVLNSCKSTGKYGLKKRVDSLKSAAAKADKSASAEGGKRYWDEKFATKQAKEFRANQATKQKKFAAEAAKQRDAAAPYEAAMGNLDGATKAMISDFQTIFKPGPKVDALLSKMENADPKFQAILHHIVKLNAQKAVIAKEIIQSHMEVDKLAQEISESYAQEASFYDALATAKEEGLGPEFQALGGAIRDRSIQELVKARYYLVRAYENLTLEPCLVGSPDNPNEQLYAPLDVTRLVKRFDAHVNASLQHAVPDENGKSPLLSETPEDGASSIYGVLKPLLMDLPQEIASKLIDALQQQGGAGKVIFHTYKDLSLKLTDDQISTLNGSSPGVSCQINPILALDLQLNLDRAAILNIRVAKVKLKSRTATGGQNGDQAILNIRHPGEGLFKSENQFFLARAGVAAQDQQSGALKQAAIWTYQLGLDDHKAEPIGFSDQTLGLIKDVLTAFGVNHEDASDAQKSAAEFFVAMPVITDLVLDIQSTDGWAEIEELELAFDVAAAHSQVSGGVLRLDSPSGANMPFWLEQDGSDPTEQMTPFLMPFADSTEVTIWPGDRGPKQAISDDENKDKQVANKKISGLKNVSAETKADITKSTTRPGWKVSLPVREGAVPSVFHIEVEEEAATFAAPTNPIHRLIWSYSRAEAIEDGFLNKDNTNWKAGRQVSYAYSYVDIDGNDSGHGFWTAPIEIGRYVFPGLTAFTPDPSANSVKFQLWRRFRKGDGAEWSAAERVEAYDFVEQENGKSANVEMLNLADVGNQYVFRMIDRTQ